MPRPVRAVWRRTPLWLRLIAALLALSFAALTVMGLFGARLLRTYLIDQLDNQLRDAAAVVTRNEPSPSGSGNVLTGAATALTGGEQPPRDSGAMFADLFGLLADANASRGPTLPSDFHVALQGGAGELLGQFPSLLRADEPPPDLPEMTPEEAEERGGTPFTVSSEGDGGASWRVLPVPLGRGLGTLVVAASLEDVDATVQRLIRIDMIVGAVVLVGLAGAGYLSVRTSLRPLTRIEETAATIAEGDLSRRVPDQHPRTEVGRLGRSLNVMLNQIETAFRERETSEATARRSEEKMRRFVADASHELRTPLTSIRGFAELHRQGAVTERDDVAALVRRIEGEATRMGLLVDDLLLLARLDEERPFERTSVDLVAIAGDAVEAARPVAADRDISCESEDGGELIVTGDAARLRQVVTNLLDNALAHTPDGSPITVAVRSGEMAPGRPCGVLEVRDQGPGLTPDQAEHVFERFYRTDAARSRAQGGTGLGLSIVAAITAAHGGRTEVDSTPGHGSTFRICLPLGIEADDGDPGDHAGDPHADRDAGDLPAEVGRPDRHGGDRAPDAGEPAAEGQRVPDVGT